MARADLLIRLVRSASRGDQPLFRKAVEALIAEERAKEHHILAERLEESLQTNGSGRAPIQRSLSPGSEQILEVWPQRRLDDLVLPRTVEGAIDEVIEEHHRGELLHSHNLEPRHRLLLAGPPGNGKTSLAEAVATELAVPLCVVRYEGVVASYLGETSTRLERLFEHVRTRHCVLFFDEFDTLGKERGDEHETGEIKRVVSNLLLQIDRLPAHVVVVTATNHPELLDRAVWRRFQLRLELPRPDEQALTRWLCRTCQTLRLDPGAEPSQLARKLLGASFGEAEEFVLDLVRRQVLAQAEADPKRVLEARLEQWRTRYSPPGGEGD